MGLQNAAASGGGVTTTVELWAMISSLERIGKNMGFSTDVTADNEKIVLLLVISLKTKKLHY